MAKKCHLYRRGNQYWFRASVAVGHGQRVDMRISLRTDSLFVSKWLCSMLEAELANLACPERHMLSAFRRQKFAGSNPRVPMSELRAMVKDHFVTMLDHAHRKRQNLGLADWSPESKSNALAKSDYIDLLLTTGTTRTSVDWRKVEAWRDAQITTGAMTAERADAACALLLERANSGDNYPFSKVERDWLPFKSGRQLSVDDEVQLDYLMLSAERQFWSEVMGDWRRMPMHDGNSAPDNMQGQPQPAVQLMAGVVTSSDGSPFAGPPFGAGQDQPIQLAPAAPAAAPVGTVTPVGEALTLFVAALEKDNGGVFRSRNQILSMGKILCHVVGGPQSPVGTITQRHLGLFVETLRALPTAWGRTPAEQKGGIQVSLNRAAGMQATKIGPTAVTEGRHLTYLKKFLDFCGVRGFAQTKDLDVNGLRKERSKQRRAQKINRGRENWTPEEFQIMLKAPVYTGCAGPSRSKRHKPGRYLYHDSAYWMPLILALQGPRSAEAGGLPVIHIREDQPIPSFVIEVTDDRGVKTANSVREVPIHPELVRLGFLEFVAAVRAAGYTHLFPDLIPEPGTKATFASNYYKIFQYFIKSAFPAEALSAAGSGASKKKDVHSIRGLTITVLENSSAPISVISKIVGHYSEPKKPGETPMNPVTKRYISQPTLPLMLNAMAALTPLTQALQPVPIKQNPLIYKRK